MNGQVPARASKLKLSYCYGGIAIYEPSEVLGPRLLHDFEAVLIIEGFPLYKTESGYFQNLEPGSILLARPGSRETYRWDTKGRTRHAYLHFNLDAIPTDWPCPAEWPRVQANPPMILGQLFRHLTERAAKRDDWPAVKPGAADNRVFETFLDLFLTTSSQTSAVPQYNLSEPVRLAAKFMRERLDALPFEPFTLVELATAAHVSTKHLCRIFRREFGFSPMKAVRLMQFQLAIPLLARSNCNIKEISERCGFPDQLYFSRAFSQAFGSPPSQMRKSMLEGKPPPPIPLPPALTPRFFW